MRAHIGAIWSGGRLFIGMYTFLIASIAFAYLFCRSSNNALLWRPNDITAPSTFGWTIYALTVLMALMAIYGQRRLRQGGVDDWQVAGWTGVVAGLLALLFQSWEFGALPFNPGSSGYASTFIGYAIFNIITIVITTYWLETTLARSLRLRKGWAGRSPSSRCTPRRSPFAQTWRR